MSLSILHRLFENKSLFAGKRVLVIGDIALDRTFTCRESVKAFHATHAGNEPIFDVEKNGDDFGTVGSANNICLFVNSFDAESELVCVIGKDEEGMQVKEALARSGIKRKLIELEKVQTITRYRFFVYCETDGRYDLKFRVDKEPDYSEAERQSVGRVRKKDFLEWFTKNISCCDALLVNDTEKGFISKTLLDTLAEPIQRLNLARISSGKKPLLTIIDPKNDWEKFIGFPVSIIKANFNEACKSVWPGLTDTNKIADRNLYQALGEKYGAFFKKIVITLGRRGALLLETELGYIRVFEFPAFESKPSEFHVATHCGDVFGAAMLLALTHNDADMYSAVTFGNYVGSLQFSKKTGTKVQRQDVLDSDNWQYMNRKFIAHRQIANIPDKKEMIVREVLTEIGKEVKLSLGKIIIDGKQSRLLAGKVYAKHLQTLKDMILPGRILFIHGESGSGKGAILENLQLFIDGYDEKIDKRSAKLVLRNSKTLEKAIEQSRKRRTCLLLDEIQAAGSSIGILNTRFSDNGFNEPFCLIVAGHAGDRGACQELEDLFNRATKFNVPPLRDEARQHCIPYLVANILKQSRPDIEFISAIALRELLRCDYNTEKSKNFRALKSVIEASCKKAKGNILEWEDLDFSVIGYEKADFRPYLSELAYNTRISL